MRICIVYICAYIVLVCIGIYIYAHVHFLCGCNIEPRRAFVPCNLCSRFHHCSRFDHFCRVMRWLLAFCTSIPLQAFLCTFCRTFCPQRLQRSFYTVCRAVLSDPNFRRVLLYLLHRSSLSHGSKHGKNAVIRGRGAPWGAGRAARLTLRTIFYFLFPKFFSGKSPLSFRFMPLVSMPKPRFSGSVPCMRTQETS